MVSATNHVPGRRARAFGSSGAGLADSAVQALGRSKALDGLGQTLGGAFSRVVRPGIVKDILSGTWMGHAAHPMLTDITIGSWTSALVLDLLGGTAGAPGADVLVGAGVLAALPTAITGLSDLADLGTEHERAIGAAHAVGNVTAVVLYGASYLARRKRKTTPRHRPLDDGRRGHDGAAFLGGPSVVSERDRRRSHRIRESGRGLDTRARGRRACRG